MSLATTESKPATLSEAPGPHAGRRYADPTDYISDRLGYLRYISQTYGDVAQFRMGLWHIYLLNHPDLIRQIFVTDHERTLKSKVIQWSRIVLGNGLLTNEGASHRKQRRLMAPAFHRQRIAGYADTMVRQAQALSDTWRDGDVHDLHTEMSQVTLGIIGETMFGKDTAEAGRAVCRALHANFIMLNRLTGPWHFVKGLARFRETWEFFRAGMLLNKIIYGLIAERRASSGEFDDVLQMLLDARDAEGDGQGMSDKQIRDECLIIFLAGHETTANALTWTWYALSQHPGIEAKLHAEIDAVLGGRMPTMEDVPKLPYTRMVVEESIRVFPPVYVIDRALTDDFVLNGFRVKRGATAFLSPYLIHHDARFYPDPERFDPMRWTPEEKEKRPKYCYFPFGAGPRICIGEQFAWMEGVLVLATLAQQWRARLAEGHVVELEPLFTLRPKYGMRMRIEKR